jgi:hypothetical protein
LAAIYRAARAKIILLAANTAAYSVEKQLPFTLVALDYQRIEDMPAAQVAKTACRPNAILFELQRPFLFQGLGPDEENILTLVH